MVDHVRKIRGVSNGQVVRNMSEWKKVPIPQKRFIVEQVSASRPSPVTEQNEGRSQLGILGINSYNLSNNYNFICNRYIISHQYLIYRVN